MQIPKFKCQSSDKDQVGKRQTYFDLEERMAIFGENTIKLCQALPHNVVTKPLISQVVRSATSVGANYSEANNASSRKDFRNKAHIAKKEAQETKHWLRMLQTAVPETRYKLRILWQENHELCLILQSITNKVKETS
jgi:four helix bundle protein